MAYFVVDDPEEFAELGATALEYQLDKKPRSTICLPTGDTYVSVYKKVVNDYKRCEVDFSKARIFNLDERYTLTAEHSRSFARYMKSNLLDHVNANNMNVHLIDGSLRHPDGMKLYCGNIDDALEARGVDLCMLGIGPEGHIAYNERGSAFDSRTRLVDLADRTIRDMLPQFGNDIEAVPRQAITLGIANIMKAGEVVLMANGEHKADAVYKALRCKPDASCPASALQMHENALFILDEAAASLL